MGAVAAAAEVDVVVMAEKEMAAVETVAAATVATVVTAVDDAGTGPSVARTRTVLARHRLAAPPRRRPTTPTAAQDGTAAGPRCRTETGRARDRGRSRSRGLGRRAVVAAATSAMAVAGATTAATSGDGEDGAAAAAVAAAVAVVVVVVADSRTAACRASSGRRQPARSRLRLLIFPRPERRWMSAVERGHRALAIHTCTIWFVATTAVVYFYYIAARRRVAFVHSIVSFLRLPICFSFLQSAFSIYLCCTRFESSAADGARCTAGAVTAVMDSCQAGCGEGCKGGQKGANMARWQLWGCWIRR